MDERNRKYCNISNIIGIIALGSYCIVPIICTSHYLFWTKVLIAEIGAFAYVFKMVLEIANKERCTRSILCVCIFMLDILSL
mgnify:FL=1